MPTYDLLCHPLNTAQNCLRVRASLAVQGKCLHIDYSVEGDVREIAWPALQSPQRADGLWRTTCFELFLQAEEASAYYEFNFSPSSHWAVYYFEAYRSGQISVALSRVPEVRRVDCEKGPSLQASIDLTELSELSGARSIRFAPTAVIEAANGLHSYWALRHIDAEPDFHHADGFVGVFSHGA
jgi:hypothetical protein